jgi:hypothetical protein
VRDRVESGQLGQQRRRLPLTGAIERALDQRGRIDRWIVIALALVVGLAVVSRALDLRTYWPAGVDLDIPLRAAARWAAGSQPYQASAMLVQSGPDLPYLYPPYLLPLLAPVASLPRDAVIDLWLAGCLLVSVWTCRRLAVPWLAVPFALAWPPFLEGLITGNVQVLAFAAFVGLLYGPADGAPRPRLFERTRALPNGLLAAAIGALKVTQLLPILYLLRRQTRAAIVAVLALAVLTIATMPFTGVAAYGDWLAQLQRAADPAWAPGGLTLGRSFGIPDAPVIAAGVAIALVARGRDSGAWLGIALLLATTSVHGYTFLFVLPGLMAIRRDLAIAVAALLLGSYPDAWWLATGIVAAALLCMPHWSWLRVSGATISPGRLGHALAKSTGAAAEYQAPAGQDGVEPVKRQFSPSPSPFDVAGGPGPSRHSRRARCMRQGASTSRGTSAVAQIRSAVLVEP